LAREKCLSREIPGKILEIGLKAAFVRLKKIVLARFLKSKFSIAPKTRHLTI